MGYSESGLIIPSTTELGNRHFGYVVGISKGCEDHGFEFGDLVEMSRWGGQWWLNPFKSFSREYGAGVEGYYESEDGTRRIEALGTDKFWRGDPGKVIGLIQRYGSSIEDQGMAPLMDRILVELRPKPKSGSIKEVNYDYGPNSEWGKVVSVGPLVDSDDLMPGDDVFMERRVGTWWKNRNTGRYYSIIRSGYVLLRQRSGGSDVHVEEVAYSA